MKRKLLVHEENDSSKHNCSSSSSSSFPKTLSGILLNATPLPIELTRMISNYLPRLIYGIKETKDFFLYAMVLNISETGQTAELIRSLKIGSQMKQMAMVNDRYLLIHNEDVFSQTDIFTNKQKVLEYPRGVVTVGNITGNDEGLFIHSLGHCHFFHFNYNRYVNIGPTPSAAILRSTVCCYKNELYIHQYYKSECYNMETKKWRPLGNSGRTVRLDSVSVAYNNEILVMGGIKYNGKLLTTVDIYHPSTDAWTLADWTLPIPLSNFYAQCVTEQLIINNTDNYWIFNPIAKTWHMYSWPECPTSNLFTDLLR